MGLEFPPSAGFPTFTLFKPTGLEFNPYLSASKFKCIHVYMLR